MHAFTECKGHDCAAVNVDLIGFVIWMYINDLCITLWGPLSSACVYVCLCVHARRIVRTKSDQRSA